MAWWHWLMMKRCERKIKSYKGFLLVLPVNNNGAFSNFQVDGVLLGWQDKARKHHKAWLKAKKAKG